MTERPQVRFSPPIDLIKMVISLYLTVSCEVLSSTSAIKDALSIEDWLSKDRNNKHILILLKSKFNLVFFVKNSRTKTNQIIRLEIDLQCKIIALCDIFLQTNIFLSQVHQKKNVYDSNNNSINNINSSNNNSNNKRNSVFLTLFFAIHRLLRFCANHHYKSNLTDTRYQSKFFKCNKCQKCSPLILTLHISFAFQKLATVSHSKTIKRQKDRVKERNRERQTQSKQN